MEQQDAANSSAEIQERISEIMEAFVRAAAQSDRSALRAASLAEVFDLKLPKSLSDLMPPAHPDVEAGPVKDRQNLNALMSRTRQPSKAAAPSGPATAANVQGMPAASADDDLN